MCRTKLSQHYTYQHTYFVNEDQIISIFESEGYTCERKTKFKDHSMFFHFTRATRNIVVLPKVDVKQLQNYFADRERMLRSYSFTTPTVLVPGGHFASIVYQHIPEDLRHNILFALDNDKMKHGKRIYGTDCYVKSFVNIVFEVDVNIVIIACPYQNELQKQCDIVFPNHKKHLLH